MTGGERSCRLTLSLSLQMLLHVQYTTFKESESPNIWKSLFRLKHDIWGSYCQMSREARNILFKRIPLPSFGIFLAGQHCSDSVISGCGTNLIQLSPDRTYFVIPSEQYLRKESDRKKECAAGLAVSRKEKGNSYHHLRNWTRKGLLNELKIFATSVGFNYPVYFITTTEW